ncbi:MAG: sulfite exporter TauE/SafE family protein [Magnetospirillum sp.]
MNDALIGLESGLAVCRVVVETHGGLLTGLFLTGVIGSLSHCAGMCGPFVLSQVAARLESLPAAKMNEFRRLTGAALLPYHLGRATTYGLLGALAGWAAGTLSGGGVFRYVAGGLLALAALFLVGMAIPRLKGLLGGGGGESWWSRHVAGLAKPLFATPTGWRGWMLGVLLGFIPCGLLYAALAASAASGDPLASAFGMLAFAAGTVPVLVVVGGIGHFAIGQWREQMLKWAPLLLVANAGMLGYMAWALVA